MKIPPRHRLETLLILLLGAPRLLALVPSEWEHRQTLVVTGAAVVRVPLPPSSLDAAGPGAADLRIVDPQGAEVPYLFDDARRRERIVAAFSPEVRIVDGATLVTFQTGTDEKLASVALQGYGQRFSRTASAEVSADGTQWETVASGVPFFSDRYASNLELPLHGRTAQQVRIRVSAGPDPQPNLSAGMLGSPTLTIDSGPAPALLPSPVTITRREEFSGETVLTLALEGSHLPLGGLSFAASDPLFTRRVNVAVRQANTGPADEMGIGNGTIYRAAVPGTAVRESLTIPLEQSPGNPELIVHILNNDSPPLAIESLSVLRRPVSLIFRAPGPGSYWLLSGNPRAKTAQYDLAAFDTVLRRSVGAVVPPGPLEATPDYHPNEALAAAPLPDVPLVGAELDPHQWTVQRPLNLTRPGVQELELDLPILAHGWNDLRIIHRNHQIPYLEEAPQLTRVVPVTLEPAPDPARSNVSRWSLTLPEANVDFSTIALTSPSPLFDRTFYLKDQQPDYRGDLREVVVSQWVWRKRAFPDEPKKFPARLGLRLAKNLFLETDNGDNAPITLSSAELTYPVHRLIFKADEVEGYYVIYGNPQAGHPKYDLDLVAERLLTSVRYPATVVPEFANPSRSWAMGQRTGYVFWGALALVVAGLLAVVAKLAPKAPPDAS